MTINVLNFIFFSFTLVIIIIGGLINIFERYLPNTVKQSFRYGKASHKGGQCNFASSLEVPKAWFKHFYVFAAFLSSVACILVSRSYIFAVQQPPNFILQFFDLMTGSVYRPIEVQSANCLVAVALITLQCMRRWYETHYIQIFSSRSKINLSHYLVGYCHYFATIAAILANAEGFVRGSKVRPPQLADLNLCQIGAIIIFVYSWFEQYRANLILVNLRKDRNGKVITDQHLMPQGGWFEYISSPHMLFEAIMYISLSALMPNCVTMRYAAFWVLTNQIEAAWLAHKWYRETFGAEYPKERRAILPMIL